MALPEGKKRIAIFLTEKEIEIIQTVSKKERRNVSDTVALMIEEHLLPQYEEIIKKTSQNHRLSRWLVLAL